MEFFASFWAALGGVLNQYISVNAQALATALEPTLFTCGIIYVMIWGYLQMTGKMEEPLMVGLKRILLLGLVFAVSTRMLIYHQVIVAFFYDGPVQFAQAVFHVSEPIGVIDSIWTNGNRVAEHLLLHGTLMDGSAWYVVTALGIWIFMGWLCVYTLFLIAFAKVALAVLLALGPLFLILLLFDSTREYFMRWISQLSVYAMTIIVTVMTAALILRIVGKYAQDTAARGADVGTVDALDMILSCVLGVLFMMNVLSVASSLAGGFAINLQGGVGRILNGLRMGTTGVKLALTPFMGAGRFTHGALMDRDLRSGDTLGRRLGKRTGNAVRAFIRGPNAIKPA